ncbi:glyoxalase family protein [Phaeobacter italicus]|uniref:lactoylglutathione lyase family protein n=1 Tax=Phaeobacter italicus TaxID=481446 RepID=UPI00277A9E9D|nr:lactoylglutathione lyase family protein [Phaeobacter italicus]GLO73896.1 glyoxalase family protein [Phaeobacter italicus]
MLPTPRGFSHIGLSVPDLDAATRFYRDVLGFYVIMDATEVVEDDSEIGRMCTDVFGKGWGSLRIAHLSTADRVGIELFEFEANQAPDNNLDFRRHGIFHFCVQDPDIEGLTQKIVAAGGKQRMPIREYYPGEKPYKMVYVEDPFGNVFEIYTHSYELTYSPGAYA